MMNTCVEYVIIIFNFMVGLFFYKILLSIYIMKLYDHLIISLYFHLLSCLIEFNIIVPLNYNFILINIIIIYVKEKLFNITIMLLMLHFVDVRNIISIPRFKKRYYYIDQK